MIIQFITKPTSTGNAITTRIVPGPDYTQAELDAAVSAKHNVPAATCAAIGREYFHLILTSPAARRSLDLFGLLGIRPTTGGSKPTPDDFHDATDLKLDISITYLADAIRALRESSTIEKVGHEGAGTPELETIENMATGTISSYTAGQMLHISGSDLDFTRSMASNPGGTMGVFIQPGAGGAWVHLTTYGSLSSKNVQVLIPTGTTGAQNVKVINERGLEGVFGTSIGPA